MNIHFPIVDPTTLPKDLLTREPICPKCSTPHTTRYFADCYCMSRKDAKELGYTIVKIDGEDRAIQGE